MSKEFKIGILAVVAIALLYYGFNFLRGSDLFSPTNRYYVTYPNVSGLNVSNPIYFNGLPVGRVSGFQLQQARGHIVVSLDIDRGVKIGEDAKATLSNDGLFGSKAVILDVGKSQELLEAGDTLRSDIDGDLLSQFEPVADNLNVTITKLNTLLDQFNETDIKGTVDTLKYSIGTLTRKANRLNVEEPISNINDLILSFDARSEELKGVIEGSKTLMDSLNQLELSNTIKNLNQSLSDVNELMAAIKNGEGTIGKLMVEDSIYNNLNELLVNLDQLVIHFNDHPKDFLRPLGRKNKKLRGTTIGEAE